MKITRFLYRFHVQNSDVLDNEKLFTTEEEALQAARHDFRNALRKLDVPHTGVSLSGDFEEVKISDLCFFNRSEWSAEEVLCWDGDGATESGSIEKVEIELTEDEVESAYRAREEHYRTLDAKNQLLYYLGIDSEYEMDEPYAVEIADDFERECGITLNDAISEDSEDSLLDVLVSDFFQTQDCNEPDNVIWENAIEKELRWLKASRPVTA